MTTTDTPVTAGHEAAFLVALAEHGISPDVQELLVAGDGRGKVAPGALRKALRAALASAPAGDGELAKIIACMDQMLADPKLDALAFDKHDSRIIRAALARPRAAVGERPDDEALDPHLPDTVKSERRCGIQRSDWMTGWFVPWSPRNDNQNAEGPWSHWVALAHAIIAADERAILDLQSAATKAEAPFPQPERREGRPPCGECHLPAGEACDICGARQ